MDRPGRKRYRTRGVRSGRAVTMEPFTSAVGVLSAMITPAVLISACGTLVVSTSTRLGRIVDRVRDLSDRFEQLVADPTPALQAEKRAMILGQLALSTSRARLLQRALTSLYLAIGMFVSTTVAIGIIAVAGGQRYTGLPVILGLTGSCFLCYGSSLLILEARLAFTSTRKEMDFLWRMSQHYAPSPLSKDHQHRPI